MGLLILGSSLTFSAQGEWGKGKKIAAAKNSAVFLQKIGAVSFVGGLPEMRSDFVQSMEHK
jgi:hypothetical protein